MSSHHYQQSEILFNQGRYQEAIPLLKAAITEDPEDLAAKNLLSLCYCEIGEPNEAIRVAGEILSIAPHNAESHFVMAYCLLENNHSKEALKFANQSIEIDPEDERYFILRAKIQGARSYWDHALEDIDEALKIAPDNTSAINFKNIILVQLKRKGEAFVGIDESLRRDPNDANSHAGKGWALMHQGEFKEAEIHFREALRLEPNHEFAKEGVMECLRAKSGIYALLMRFYLFMSTLTPLKQFAILIGAYVVIRFLDNIETDSQPLKIGLTVIVITYLFFALSTWLSKSVINFFFQFNRFARIALDSREKLSGNIIMLLLTIGGVSFLIYQLELLGKLSGIFIMIAIYSVSFALPMSRYLESEPGRQRTHYQRWVLGFTAYIAMIFFGIFFNESLAITLISSYQYLLLAFCLFGNFRDN